MFTAPRSPLCAQYTCFVASSHLFFCVPLISFHATDEIEPKKIETKKNRNRNAQTMIVRSQIPFAKRDNFDSRSHSHEQTHTHTYSLITQSHQRNVVSRMQKKFFGYGSAQQQNTHLFQLVSFFFFFISDLLILLGAIYFSVFSSCANSKYRRHRTPVNI